MTAQQQQNYASGIWQTDPELTNPAPEQALLDWLVEPGLLTARLRTQCGPAFHLEVVSETSATSEQVEGDLSRQIVLRCGDTPCVFAESHLPKATLEAHDWLRDLGNEPLGERLQSRSDISRGPFTFSVADIDLIPAKLQRYAGDTLYARRSNFFIGEHELTVTEIFFPTVVNCGLTSD